MLQVQNLIDNMHIVGSAESRKNKFEKLIKLVAEAQCAESASHVKNPQSKAKVLRMPVVNLQMVLDFEKKIEEEANKKKAEDKIEAQDSEEKELIDQ